MKSFVDVIAKHDREGKVTPLVLIWEDGRRYTIDRVLDERKASSLKSGGTGMRYTCRIKNKDTYLYEDNG